MKIISVPTSLEAMARIDVDECVLGDLEEIQLTQSEFDELWRAGLFDALNNELGTTIDDYEDEAIHADLLDRAIEVINIINRKGHFGCMEKVRCLFNLAKEKQTGVYFFF